jgi:phosphate starvation-inducible PhoH-like protein
MGKSGKKKRLYDMYIDDMEDEVFFMNTIKNQSPQLAQSPQSPRSQYIHNNYLPCGPYNINANINPNTTNSINISKKPYKTTNKIQNKHASYMQNTPMNPRNIIQDAYINQINNDAISIVLATGPAGTGKSCIAVSAAIDLFNKGVYERIVITRPAVTVDEDHGFLPGKIEDKLDPWVRPLYDTFYKYYTPDEVKSMIAQKIIDICPLAYLRGRTLENSFIIIDEAQNCSVKQMLMALTRIGANSKMVITGDPSQHDRGYEKSGLTDLIERLYKNRSYTYKNQ